MRTDVKIPPAKVARVVERFRHHLYRLHQRSAPAPAVMFELVLGAWVAQAIQAAAELGIADVLAEGPLPLDDLAACVGANPDVLRRLMRALISQGIFRQRRDGRYALTALADALRSDAPFSMHGWARVVGAPQHRDHWSLLVEAVKSGKAILPQLRGKEAFDYLKDEPELAKAFNDAMTTVSGLTAIAVVAGYDFGRYRTIVDVGGGQGACWPPLWRRHRRRGACSSTCLKSSRRRRRCCGSRESKTGFASRVGHSLTVFRPAGDAYIIKSVIHDWPEAQAVAVLRKVREAVGADATVLVIELVLPEHDRDFAGKWVDLEMLVQANGRERTAAEYRDLLRYAGFRMTRVVQTAAPFSIIEATPA